MDKQALPAYTPEAPAVRTIAPTSIMPPAADLAPQQVGGTAPATQFNPIPASYPPNPTTPITPAQAAPSPATPPPAPTAPAQVRADQVQQSRGTPAGLDMSRIPGALSSIQDYASTLLSPESSDPLPNSLPDNPYEGSNQLQNERASQQRRRDALPSAPPATPPIAPPATPPIAPPATPPTDNLQPWEEGYVAIPPVPQPTPPPAPGPLDGTDEAAGPEAVPEEVTEEVTEAVPEAGPAAGVPNGSVLGNDERELLHSLQNAAGTAVPYAVDSALTRAIAKTSQSTKALETLAKNRKWWQKIPGLAKSFVPGTGLGTTAAAGGGLSGVAATAMPVIGGFTAANAVQEAMDGVGLLPQWAGGTGFLAPKSWGGSGTDAFGWDQKGFNRGVSQSSVGGQMWDAAWNPLKAITNIGAGGAEFSTYGAGKLRDVVTGTTPESRHTATNKREMQSALTAEQSQLRQQAVQVWTAHSATTDPAQKAALKQQYAELQKRVQDATSRAEAMNDDTQNWNLGNQHWFGDQGHKFRDAIRSTSADQTNQIEKQQPGALGREYLQSRRDEANNLNDLYEKEVGYTGEGDFTKQIRMNVMSAKRRIVDIGARMREPGVASNPAMLGQLSAELQHHNQRLKLYQGWADKAGTE
jgi:hypothetical protein